jgi:tetratricopeptide (TPR) repeat protein
VSQSPVDAAGGDAEGGYLEGWMATEQQVREGRSWSGYERHCAYLNLGGTRFVDASAAGGLDFAEDGRALGVVDWDQDGDLDLWLRNRTSPGLRFLRNDLDRGDRAVSLLLEGEAPNTGAIGARVELHAQGAPFPVLRRSVRAGSAYLSQSSKRLHFGLGDAGSVERVVVHWPSGTSETVTGIERGGRYLIRQGQGRAQALPERRSVDLTAEPLGKAPATDAAALSPLGPLPLPELALRRLDGTKLASTGERERPRLLVLWATWCKPCHGELAELGAAAAELEAAGLDVLLVSVDTAAEEPTATPEQVRAWLDERALPFDAALASATSVEKIELLHEALVNRKRTLALPTSLLVDRDGRLVTLLRGPASLSTVKSALALAALDGESRVRKLTDATGSWLKRPRGSDLPAVAAWFQYRGFDEDARRLMEEASGSQADRAAAEAERLRATGRLAEADALVRQVLAAEPLHAAALATLGTLGLQAGQHAAAEPILRMAVEADPERTSAWINLSHVLSVLGRHGEAAEACRRAELLEPWNADVHHGRAAVELQRGQQDAALRALRETLRLDPGRLEDARALVAVLNSRRQPTPLELAEAALWSSRLAAAPGQSAATVSR